MHAVNSIFCGFWTWLVRKLTRKRSTTSGSAYSRPPSASHHTLGVHSPDQQKRLIKPLPSRSLRSRLSPEVANSILFPPVPKTSKPLFSSVTNGKGHTSQLNISPDISDMDKALIDAQRTQLHDGVHSYQFKGNEMESDDETLSQYPRPDRRRQGPDSTPSRQYANGITRVEGSMEQSVVSENDSVDGYDSFENTNNKKKRKIPTSGSLGTHHSSLSTELANMGIVPGHAINVNGDADGLDYTEGDDLVNDPATSGTNGFSGSGRGLFGSANNRLTSRRSPLGVSANGSNASNNRSTYRRDVGPGAGSKDQGIISAAIANAASMPTPISKGQENIGLVQRQLAAKKVAPVKTQFTFTCESDNSKDIVWPGEASTYPSLNPQAQPNPPPPISHLHYQDTKPVNTTGTQTSPNMGAPANQPPSNTPNNPQQPPPQPRKPRRTAAKRYAIAARDRRMQQQHNNYYHPPRDEDIWICEFCEYESIFGHPPVALVRQYEIKDRRERKRLAEKRRLLEKAKMKGRKGRKGAKGKGGGGSINSNLNHTNHAVSTTAQQQSQPIPAEGHFHDQSTQYGGEDFGDEFDEEAPVPLDPVESPMKGPPNKITQPLGGGSGRKEYCHSPSPMGSGMGMAGSETGV